jgi:hypothetical protein
MPVMELAEEPLSERTLDEVIESTWTLPVR